MRDTLLHVAIAVAVAVASLEVAHSQSLSVNCSLNGHFNSGDTSTCICDHQWKGETCNQLNLGVSTPGYHRTTDNVNVSSWGGSVIFSPSTSTFHMFAAEFTNHCGLDAWQSNSMIIHATSKNLSAAFQFDEILFPVFAHNPIVVFAPSTSQQYVMYFEASHPPPCGFTICTCDNGQTTDQCNEMNDFDCTDGNWPSYFSHSDSLDGPWSEPTLIPNFSKGGDFNLSPIIRDDNSLFGLWRDGTIDNTPDGPHWKSHLRTFTATDWRDPNSYVLNYTDIFPSLDVAGTEDPHLYQDREGNFHAVLHDMQGAECKNLGAADGSGSCGSHLFSADGVNWHYNSIEADGLTYGGIVGGEIFTRRERPHLIFDERGEIIALSTSAMFGTSDESFTHIQLID